MVRQIRPYIAFPDFAVLILRLVATLRSGILCLASPSPPPLAGLLLGLASVFCTFCGLCFNRRRIVVVTCRRGCHWTVSVGSKGSEEIWRVFSGNDALQCAGPTTGDSEWRIKFLVGSGLGWLL
jgi:hypothetical protein